MAGPIRTYIRRHHVALIALFFALSGTAVASHERIKSSDVVNNSLKGVDVRSNSLTGDDVRNNSLTGDDIGSNSLTGDDIGSNSLTGDDIDEASLARLDSSDVIDSVGPLPLEGTFTSGGGKIAVFASGSGFRSSVNADSHGKIGMQVFLDGTEIGFRSESFANEMDSHRTFTTEMVAVQPPAGSHTIRLEARYFSDCNTMIEAPNSYCTTTDSNDAFQVLVIELP